MPLQTPLRASLKAATTPEPNAPKSALSLPILHIARAADFERVLRTRSRSQTQHFAVHHLPDRPSLTARALRAAVIRKLSTGHAPEEVQPVDELPAVWAGAVVPKRHARRAVTRTLLKRQIRAAFERHCPSMKPGLWVVRLRAPFDKTLFPSAASDQLKRIARGELDQLFAAAAAART